MGTTNDHSTDLCSEELASAAIWASLYDSNLTIGDNGWKRVSSGVMVRALNLADNEVHSHKDSIYKNNQY
jgi:hypothetical protein